MNQKLIRLNQIKEYKDFDYEVIQWDPKNFGIELLIYYEVDSTCDLEYISSSDLDIKCIKIAHSGQRLQFMKQKNYDHVMYLIDHQFNWDSIIDKEQDFRDNPYPH